MILTLVEVYPLHLNVLRSPPELLFNSLLVYGLYMAVKKQYRYTCDISFECEYPDVETAYNSNEPNSFDNYEIKNLKLVNSLTKKGETDATDVSASTKS